MLKGALIVTLLFGSNPGKFPICATLEHAGYSDRADRTAIRQAGSTTGFRAFFGASQGARWIPYSPMLLDWKELSVASSLNTKPGLNQIVLVIDDDESMRVGLNYLFQSMDLPVQLFSSATELLKTKLPEIPSCLVLDIRLPGVNGLEFQDVLKSAGMHIPIIFMTGHGDIPMSVRAMKAGAVDFLVIRTCWMP